MRLLPNVIVVLAVLLAFSCSLEAGIAPHNVAVIVNTDSFLGGKSIAVGEYYCAQAGIPSSNLIGVQTARVESATLAEYDKLAEEIRNALVNQIGVDPEDPAHDPIQCLVMCYGIPFRINFDPATEREADSVDSWLTLLFNRDPDLGPPDVTSSGVFSPYYGKDINFADFRASADNSFSFASQTCRTRYLVCRLDGYTDPLLTIPGYDGQIPQDIKDMIDRAHGISVVSARHRGSFGHVRSTSGRTGKRDLPRSASPAQLSSTLGSTAVRQHCILQRFYRT